MSTPIHATYRAGVLHPDRPLDLPENTSVELLVSVVAGATDEGQQLRPTAPRISTDELRDRVARYGIDVGALSPTFSRADIYQDDE